MMKNTYQIKINQGKESKILDVTQAGTKGQAVTVKAVEGARYQLVDTETKFGPENIRASRQGKDLKISFEGSNTTDLVIEDYYKVTPEGFNGLIGEAESGKFYEYIPESASGMASVPMLADSGQTVGMALGGSEVAGSGAAVGLLAAGLFSPWLLGAGLLGLAAAGGGGGSSGSTGTGTGTGPDTTAPTGQTGSLAAVAGSDSGKLGDNLTSITKPTITGKAEAGSTVEVSFRDPANKLTGPYKTTADANGNYTFQVPNDLLDTSADTKGTKYTPVIKVTDAAGNSSTADGTPFVLDTQAAAVTLQIDADGNNDGYINAAEKGSATTTSVTAILDRTKMVAGDVITLTDGTTTKTVTLTDADISAGKVVTSAWTLPQEGQSLKVTATVKDLASNVSAVATDAAVVDTVSPNGGAAVVLTIDLDSSNDGTINADEKGSATTTSLTAAFDKTTVNAGDIITFSDGVNSKSVTLTSVDIAAGKVTSQGWALPIEGSTLNVTAVLKDPGGNAASVAADTAKIDTTPPMGQTGALAAVVGSDSGNLGDNLTNITKPTITGKAEAGSNVEVSFRDPANKLTGPYKTTADANGNYSLQVPSDLLDASVDTKGTKYTPVIKATDAAGNSSTADGTPFVLDTKALDLTVTIDADANNNGVISYIENGNSATSKDLSVTASFDKTKAKEGDVVHFQLNSGTDQKVTLTQVMVDAGQAVFTFVKGIVDVAVLKVSAWFVDTASNQSATATDEAKVDLSVAVHVTSIAGDDMINQGESLKPNTTVNGTATGSGTVWLKVGTAVVGSATVGTDGTWSTEVLTSSIKGATSLSAELKSASGSAPLATDPSHGYSLDLSADASTVGQTLTALENLAYKPSSTGIWMPLMNGVKLTDSGAYSLADASGNLYKPPSTNAADQVVAYSTLNTSNTPASSSELQISQLLASSDGLHINYASLSNPAVKSVSLADGKANIMSIDSLDVLNHGVLNVLEAGLGQNPQFKVFGDASGDSLKLTNLLGGKGAWTAAETVTLVGDTHSYTHYSAYALGLEIDLLVDKNIVVTIV